MPRHKAGFQEMLYENENLQIVKKDSAVVNHPLPGGAKLRKDDLETTGVGVE